MLDTYLLAQYIQYGTPKKKTWEEQCEAMAEREDIAWEDQKWEEMEEE